MSKKKNEEENEEETKDEKEEMVETPIAEFKAMRKIAKRFHAAEYYLVYLKKTSDTLVVENSTDRQYLAKMIAGLDPEERDTARIFEGIPIKVSSVTPKHQVVLDGDEFLV